MDAKQELGIEKLIESFNETYPNSNISTKNKSLCESLMELVQLENSPAITTMDEISNKYYMRRMIENATHAVEAEKEYEWPFLFCPYFSQEEVAQLQGYYSDESYYEAMATQYNPRPWHKKIATLQMQLKDATDPEEVERIKQDMINLGWDPESEESFDYVNEATGTQFKPRPWHKKIMTLQAQLKATEDPDEIERIKRTMMDLGWNPENKESYDYLNESFDPVRWDATMRQLTFWMESTDDWIEKDRIKQTMVDFGWNPEIEYNTENMVLAKRRIENIYKERYCDTLTLDLRPFIEEFDDSSVIQETKSDSGIHPVHIVLVKGNSPFSQVIGSVTQGEFSHSAICLDNDFDRLYSFNLDNQLNHGGGFSLESIRNYPKDNRLAVFSFFVNHDDYNKIQERVQLLLNNIKSTTYSIANILMFPFKHINLNLSDSMICSQFVDSIMKMVNVDITGKDSSKVSPNFLYSKSVDNKKIYKIFDGIVSEFNPKKAERYINRMSKKAKSTNMMESEAANLLSAYLYPVVLEARKFPIEIKDNGDILLTNKFVDFDSEYSASHKLLLEYEKAGNIEGMKYELARLYYMNYILEKRLYHNKYLAQKEKNMKTRARVLNDFNKYMKVVLKEEPDFNFGAYYEASPFYAHTVEVSGSTVHKIKDIINCIL